MRFYMERVEANRNFANKIWNASKFVIMNLEDYDPEFVPTTDDFTLADRWILTSFNQVVPLCPSLQNTCGSTCRMKAKA